MARGSHSNYLMTGPSIASTFHMDYLDFLASDPRIAGDNWQPIFEMLDDHRAARFLEARGYDLLPVRLLVGRDALGARSPTKTIPSRSASSTCCTSARRCCARSSRSCPGDRLRDAAGLGQRQLPANCPAGRDGQGDRTTGNVRSTSSGTCCCRTARSRFGPDGRCLTQERTGRARRDAGLRRPGRLRG